MSGDKDGKYLLNESEWEFNEEIIRFVLCFSLVLKARNMKRHFTTAMHKKKVTCVEIKKGKEAHQSSIRKLCDKIKI